MRLEEWHPRNPWVTNCTSLYEKDCEPSFAKAIGNDNNQRFLHLDSVLLNQRIAAVIYYKNNIDYADGFRSSIARILVDESTRALRSSSSTDWDREFSRFQWKRLPKLCVPWKVAMKMSEIWHCYRRTAQTEFN